MRNKKLSKNPHLFELSFLISHFISYLCSHSSQIGVLAQPSLTKQGNGKTKNNSDRAVHAFQHCLLCLSHHSEPTGNISVLGISLTGGLLVFPISYIINDCVSEVWGFKKARLLIWTGFAMNFFVVSIGALCDMIPGAP